MSFLIWPSQFVAAGGGGHPLASLFTGQQGGIWDISVTSSLYQSGTRASPGAAVTSLNDPIGLILDQSGNDNDLAITSTQRPLYKPNSGLPYALFDGSNDAIRALFTTGTTFDRITALQVVAFSGGNECYIGGGSVDTMLFGNGSDHWQMWNNSSAGPEVAPSVSTDYVLTERWVGAAPCQLRLDNNSFVSTPSISGVNPGGVTYGARRNDFDPANMRLYGSIMIDGALGSTDLATCVTYMGALQGRSL